MRELECLFIQFKYSIQLKKTLDHCSCTIREGIEWGKENSVVPLLSGYSFSGAYDHQWTKRIQLNI